MKRKQNLPDLRNPTVSTSMSRLKEQNISSCDATRIGCGELGVEESGSGTFLTGSTCTGSDFSEGLLRVPPFFFFFLKAS